MTGFDRNVDFDLADVTQVACDWGRAPVLY